jgi:hypothetical protein
MNRDLVEHFLNGYNSDELVGYVSLCGGSSKLTRKMQRAEYIASCLQDPEKLRWLWEQMAPDEQRVVAVAYHNGGHFDDMAYQAQYGNLPESLVSHNWYYTRDAHKHISLFLSRSQILPGLMPLLAGIVPPSERFQLTGLEEAPAAMVYDTEVAGKVEIVAFNHADTEEAGWHDLLVFLQLINQGLITFSSSSSRLTPKSAQTLLRHLLDGDFEQSDTEPVKVDETIRVYGLTIFALHAGLVSALGGGKLTPKGQAFLTSQDPELLLEAFETWSSQGSFEELTRIQGLRGLRSKGIHLTDPGERREKILEALSWCPTGVWIPLEEFYRAVKIWRFNFKLEEEGLNKLYVGSRRSYDGYYSSWASPDNMWLLTNGIYINVILWEYLATLGALDLLYIPAEEAQLLTTLDEDPWVFNEFYFDEDESFSRYDGLCYFRINPLGAYLLGHTAEYQPPSHLSLEQAFFQVDAERQVKLLDPQRPIPMVMAQLIQVAVETAPGCYRLDQEKLLPALEQGLDIKVLIDFLHRHNQGTLPPEIDEWLQSIYQASRAFSIKSKALIIRASGKEVAEKVLADPELSRICTLLDGTTLVISASHESRFRNRLRQLGYGVRA